MRTVLLHNRELGDWIRSYLLDRGDLIASFPVGSGVYVDDVREFEPECVLSVKWDRILDDEWLAVAPLMLNLHNGFLPWNRGANPNIWPLVDGSPAGVTLHHMTAHLDGGPLVCQWLVEPYSYDTAVSLGVRLDFAARRMLETIWPKIDVGCGGLAQDEGGSYHRVSDLQSIDPLVRARLGVYLNS